MSDEEEDFVDTGFGLAKVSDAERAKRQEIQRTRSVEGMKLRWQDQDRMELEEKAKLYAPPIISEPRCHVCQHPNRLFIEQQIVKGRSASSIAQSVPPNPETGKALDHRSIKGHYQKHMDLDSAVIRGVMDEEAQLLGQNIEEGLAGAFSIRGALNVLIRKAFDDAMAGITTVEPKDLIQMAKLYNDMDSSSATKMIEEAQSSISIFMAAIQNVFKDNLDQDQAEELSIAIRQEVRRLREQDEIEAQIENHLKELPRG
jgi:hypothetical protein